MKKIIASAFLFLPFHYLFSGVSFSKGEVSDTLSDAKKYNYSENIILEDYSGKDNCLWIRIPKTSSDSLLLISGVYSECRVYSDNELIKSSERFISDIPSNDFFNVSGAEGMICVKIMFQKVEKLNIKSEFVSSIALCKLFMINDFIIFSIILLSFVSVVLVLFMKTDKKKILAVSFLFSMIYIIAQILANKSFYDYALYFSYLPFISIIVMSFYLSGKKRIYKSFPAALFSLVLASQYFGNYIPLKYLPALGLIPFLSVFFIIKDDKNIEKIFLTILLSLIPSAYLYSGIELSLLSVLSIFISLIMISLVSVLRLIVFHDFESGKSINTDEKIKFLEKENTSLSAKLKRLNDEHVLTENAVLEMNKNFSDERYFSSGWECCIISDSKFMRTDAASFIDCGSYSISYILDIEGHSVDKTIASMYLKHEIFRYINKHNEKLSLFSSLLQNLSDKLGLNYIRGIAIKLNGDYAECINYSYPECYYINGRALTSGKLSFEESEKHPVISGQILKNGSKMYKINGGDYLIMYSDSLSGVMDGFVADADFSGGIEKISRRMKKAFSADDFKDDITIVILRRNQ